MLFPHFKLSRLVALGLLVALVTGCGPQVGDSDEARVPPVADDAPEVSEPQPGGSAQAPADSGSKAPASDPSIAVPNSPSNAAPNLPDTDCESPETQLEMNQCAKAWYSQEDAKLNQVYNQVKSGLSSSRQAQLTDAELAWIDFRDANCEFEANQYEGGSIQPTIYYGCLAQVTANRTAELQDAATASLSYAAADQRLNQVYQDFKDSLAASGKSSLTTAQLAWLDYRDANCAYEANTQNCLARVTLERTNQLEEQAAERSL